MVARSDVTGPTKKPKNVVERNVALLGDLMQYLLTKPGVLDSLPDDFELVILPEDDTEMRQYNLELLDIYGSEGKPVVFVRMRSGKVDFDEKRPSLYVPLVV